MKKRWWLDQMKMAIVKRLLSAGIDVNLTQYGHSALHIACYTKNIELALLLLKGGASLSILDQSGETAIQIAESEGLKDLVNIMKDYEKQYESFFKATKSGDIKEDEKSIASRRRHKN